MLNPIKFLLGFVFAFISFFSQGQTLFSLNKDTVKYSDHIGGASDTMDLSLTKAFTLLPGTGFNNSFNYANFYWFYGAPYRLAVAPSQLQRKMTFSALPHIGFAYSFGAKGFQNIVTKYAQGFKNGGLLNIDLLRQSSNGQMRNANFSNSDLWLAYLKDKGRVMTHLQASYQADDRTLNGGSTDSLNFVLFGAEFTRIKKASANSKTRIGQVLLENRFNFTGDSSKIKTGFLLRNGFTLHNRIYQEQDTIFGLYPEVNIDSLSTRDQYQENTLTNGGGYYFQTPSFEFNGALFHRYRRLQNLGRTSDTNEVSFDAAAKYSFGYFQVYGYLYQNLIGASGESSYKAQASYMHGKWSGHVEAKFTRLLPNMQQRSYFANNSNYTNPLTIQENLYITAKATFTQSKMIEWGVQGGYVDRSNMLVWNDKNWTINGLSTDRCAFLKVSARLQYKSFVLLPFLEYTYGSKYIPEWVQGGRFLITKKIFKQQKLLMTLAADVVHNEGYQTMSYSTIMDAYQMGSYSSNELLSVHGTFGLSIEEFRFYLRMENINRLGLIQGNNPNYLVDGYFATPFALKVGITWDFFN